MLFEPLPSSTINYYENNVFKGHDKIKCFEKISSQLYKIIRNNYNDELIVFLDNEYTVGTSEVDKILNLYPNVDIIIAAYFINDYTEHAKKTARQRNVGLFRPREFFGAINRKDFWNYDRRFTLYD